jgi:hypothetical protein
MSSMPDAEPAIALFPPQVRDWALPSEAALTPKAASRIVRESTVQKFAPAAAALRDDWGCTLDGKQLERWATRFGQRLYRERDAAVTDSECGIRRPPPAVPAEVLVIGVDGGRVQMREKDPATQSRWKEDKVLTITSYLKGDGKERVPEPLLTTMAASMEKTESFGRLARVEAERRHWRYAKEVIAIADCGNWIDPLLAREFPNVIRIADWAHAVEHLHASGRAVHPNDAAAARRLSEHWVAELAAGRVAQVLTALQACAKRVGRPRKNDGDEHPRRVLAQNVHYFATNRSAMDYPTYRSRGWPIGSGNTEAGVKQINKRVKGSEQFWQPTGLEAMLTLRAMYLCEDGRWAAYWASRPAYEKSVA